MHICMLLGKFREDALKTGADIQAELQMKALRDEGHTITVIAKKNRLLSPYYEKFDDCQVFRVGPPGLRSLLTCLLLLMFHKRFDIVHSHGQHTFSVAAITLCTLLHIPTVLKITIAGRVFVRTGLDKLLPRKWKLFRRLTNRFTRLASAYIAISEEIAAELPRAGFYPERIRRITNGVDTARFFPVDSEQKRQLRKKLDLPTNKNILLYSSRLTARKGYDLLLEAWPAIYERCPDTHLVIVGGGKQNLQQDIANLLKKVPPSSFRFIGQIDDPAPYLQSADVFLFPSRKEGLPNGLIEAMACGCSCVASRIGGCTDLITPDVSGKLFDPGNTSELAEAVCALLADFTLVHTMGQSAAGYIRTTYDITVVAKKIDALYRSLVAPTTPTAGKPDIAVGD